MVFISKLNKNIYPYYLPPEQDELFSSWLCRLSYNHGIKTNTFINSYLGEKLPIWNRDIDTLAPVKLLDMIEKHTPLNKDSVNSLFLKSLEGYAFERLSTHSSSKYVLSLGINHRTRKHHGQQCCTSCLSKETPYYRKSWRLVTSILCLDCNNYLIDRCYSCDYPIVFFRINMGGNKIKSTMEFEPMYLCSECKIDLRKYIPSTYPSIREKQYQKFINESIKKGYNNITMYSFTYFRVLLLLSLRLRADTVKNRFKDIVSDIYNIKDEVYKREIHLWNINERKQTLPFIYSLLETSPEKLNTIFKEGRVHKSYLVKDNEAIPFWFQKLLLY